MSEKTLLAYIVQLENCLAIWESIQAYKDVNMISSELAIHAPILAAARAAVSGMVSKHRADHVC